MGFRERFYFVLLRWRPPLSNEDVRERQQKISELHEEEISKIAKEEE